MKEGYQPDPTLTPQQNEQLRKAFQGQEVEFIIENRTSDPANPKTGQIWFRTDV